MSLDRIADERRNFLQERRDAVVRAARILLLCQVKPTGVKFDEAMEALHKRILELDQFEEKQERTGG